MASSSIARRALSLFGVVLVLLFVIGLIEGEGVSDAFSYATLWAGLSAGAYVFLQRFRFGCWGSSCRTSTNPSSEDEKRATVLHV